MHGTAPFTPNHNRSPAFTDLSQSLLQIPAPDVGSPCTASSPAQQQHRIQPQESIRVLAQHQASTKEQLPPYQKLRMVQRLETMRRTATLETRLPNPLAPKPVVRIDAHGKAALIQVDRSKIIDEFGLAYRDLRAVDPSAPQSSSAILIRERALVVNLQMVRLIIGADEIFVLSFLQKGTEQEQIGSKGSLSCRFVRHLCTRLTSRDSDSLNGEASIHSTNSEIFDAVLPHDRGHWGRADLQLPFELQALDVALSEAVNHLQHEISELHLTAAPCLAGLSHRVSAKSLQQMMELSNKRAHLTHTLEELRKQLDDIMQDDTDMLDMYLGRRVLREAGFESDEDQPILAAARTFHTPELPLSRETGMRMDAAVAAPADMTSPFAHEQAQGGRRHSIAQSFCTASLELKSEPSGQQEPMGINDDDTEEDDNDATYSDEEPAIMGPVYEVHKSGNVRRVGPVDPHDVEEVEGLLETYLLQVEYLLGKLRHLAENITQMERMVNIDLDHRRNQLVALDLLVTAITLMFSVITAVSGIFGMNLANGWENSHTAFSTTVVLSVLVGGVLLAGFLVLVQLQGLMFIPDPRAFRLHT